MRVINYNIKIDVDFENKKYKGSEHIKIEDPEKELKFDLNEIEIKKIEVNNKEVKYNLNKDYVSINNSEKDIDVYIEFSSFNARGLKGFYVAGNDKEYILSTQFEESDARRAFPCIDNPLYKATFDITLVVNSNLTAISNMPIKNEKLEKNRKIVEFEQTPVMSTYLVYLGVGHFDEMSDLYKNKRVYLTAMKNHLTESNYPIEIAEKSLNYLENYTNIDYMLPKLHLISVPEFGAGAMENWGAITFREILLTIDKSTTSRSYKRTAEVITHELVHQWFGDLVTMKWWNDLWLNESFATFFAFKTINDVYPEWNFYGDFLLDQTDGAYTMDSLINSHPINADVSDPRSISQLSYEIRYGKGSNVLRMIEAYVGNDVFMNSLRNYLKKFSYSNASGSDLWNSIEEESKKGISKIMEQWISKKGYPYLIAEKTEDKLRITQKQFYFLDENSNETWNLPLFVKRFSDDDVILMDKSSISLEGDILSLNNNHFGFYRVMYDSYLFENISRNLDRISNYEKWGIINDLYAFLLSNKIKLNEYVKRLEKFYHVNDNIIIDEISKQLYSLYSITNSNYFRDIANFYIKDKIEYIKNNRKDDFNFKISLSSLYTRLAYINDDFDRDLLKTYDNYYNIDPDFRLAYLIANARINNDFNYLSGIIINAFSDEDKTKAITASGLLKNHDKIMDFINSGSAKKQDIDSFFVSMASNDVSREFIVDNIEEIVNTMFKLELSPLRINRSVQSMIAYAGVKSPDKMRENAEKIKRDEIFGGIKKGLEFLDTYEKVIKNVN